MTGTIFQFLLGLFCIRMELGRNIFGCLGDKAAIFFGFAKKGAAFVYGENLVTVLQVFAFAVSFFFVTIIVFSMIISMSDSNCCCSFLDFAGYIFL